MGNDLTLLSLFFEGGSTRIHLERLAEHPDVRAAVRKLHQHVKQPYPALVPRVTTQYGGTMQRLVEKGGLLWSDLPLGIGDLRLFTVCFQAATTRTFWNVLSFAYDAMADEAKASMRALMGYSAKAWDALASRIDNDTKVLTPLPRAEHLPSAERIATNWNARDYWYFNFPQDENGSLYSGRKFLGLPKWKPSNTPRGNWQPTAAPSRELEGWLPILAGLLGVLGLLWLFTGDRRSAK